MSIVQDYIFQLLRIAIDRADSLDTPPSPKEWRQIFEYAKKQAIAGICFAGIEKNKSKQQAPPMDVLMDWLGVAEYIKACNAHIDEQTAFVWKQLSQEGLSAAILKGQAIATLYGALESYRSPGDIDVWVLGGFDVVNNYVQKTIPTVDIAYHRFHYDLFTDTEVELHHRPTLMRNFIDDVKLQKWYDSFSSDSFVATGKGFSTTSLGFNRIFILTHIYRHFLFEGIGLRQLMDYYYVLISEKVTEQIKNEVNELFKRFRISRFAGGIMWILEHCFYLPHEYLLCEPNSKEGHFILSEILETGNFGQNESRYIGNGTLNRMTKHSLHLIAHYPSEVMWTPIWLIYHKVWKWIKKKNIKKQTIICSTR